MVGGWGPYKQQLLLLHCIKKFGNDLISLTRLIYIAVHTSLLMSDNILQGA